MHYIKLYCIYFKSMCFVTIPLVDAATLFCLEVTVAEETKELFIISIIFKIIFDNCFKIWTIGRGLVLFWPTVIIAFSQFSSEILNVIPNALLRPIQSQSGFNNANILQIMFANLTPIGRPKKCKVEIHSIQTVFLDPINVGCILGYLLPLLFLLRVENRK